MARKLLVVDDEEMIRSSLKELFELEEYDVVIAENGTHAWELIENNSFCFVLSDAKMPNGSGIELLEKIQTITNGRPQVVLMTGDANIDREEGINKGALDLIYKPIDFQNLLQIIQDSSSPESQ
ncbi:MAG: response regulator [Halobacteriovoraceae bacterium]|jgi:two-component system, NtrC family, nitrogen regulation response regulator NtrX|nr:response regulator [Halobacteriovoraceae bacterium]MBT5094819.1 response regulator [Halobacteriovoraceae bacterium]